MNKLPKKSKHAIKTKDLSVYYGDFRAVKNQPDQNRIPFLFLDFNRIDVEHKGEQRDHVPVEVFCTAQDAQSLCAGVGHFHLEVAVNVKTKSTNNSSAPFVK